MAETQPIVLELLAERFSLGSARSEISKLRRTLSTAGMTLPDTVAQAATIIRSSALPVRFDEATLIRLNEMRERRPKHAGPVAAAFII